MKLANPVAERAESEPNRRSLGDLPIKILFLAALLFTLALLVARLAASVPSAWVEASPMPLVTDHRMAFPAESWEAVVPERQGMRSRQLDRAIERFDASTPSGGVKRLVIARHGQVVWSGREASERQGVWSITKSLSATLLGPMIESGQVRLDDPVSEWVSDLRPVYGEVTWRHLLAMTSGYEAVGDWPPPKSGYVNGGSLTPFAPSERPQFAPGTHFSYWDSASNVYGLAVTELAGESLRDLFQRHIATPIGIGAGDWEWRKFGDHGEVELQSSSGNKGKHIEMSAMDLARIGHLLLNRGRWHGTEVLSEEWVGEMTRVQVPAEMPLGGPIVDLYGERFPFDGRGTYGLGWWVNGTGPDGDRHWPGCPPGTFGAVGYNNNVLLVVPEWELVLVRLGLDGKERRMERAEFAKLLVEVGESIAR